MIFFFFSSRRRHTRYIGDWSSDVCSSDLRAGCRRQVEKDLAMSGPIRPWIVEVCERGLRCREASQKPVPIDGALLDGRSEERRVGKECRSRGSACQYKKQQNRLMRLLMAS